MAKVEIFCLGLWLINWNCIHRCGCAFPSTSHCFWTFSSILNGRLFATCLHVYLVRTRPIVLIYLMNHLIELWWKLFIHLHKLIGCWTWTGHLETCCGSSLHLLIRYYLFDYCTCSCTKSTSSFCNILCL